MLTSNKEEQNQIVVSYAEFAGIRTKLTWQAGNDLNKYQPFNQVYGVCFNEEGKMLIQRVENENWCLSGGTVEPGETAEETLRRELIEETDVTIKNLILLGGQRVQYIGGHNPNTKKGDDFYQLRYYCEIEEILPQTIDPDNGKIHQRIFVTPDKLAGYLDWGDTGKAIFNQATKIYQSLHKAH